MPQISAPNHRCQRESWSREIELIEIGTFITDHVWLQLTRAEDEPAENNQYQSHNLKLQDLPELLYNSGQVLKQLFPQGWFELQPFSMICELKLHWFSFIRFRSITGRKRRQTYLALQFKTPG